MSPLGKKTLLSLAAIPDHSGHQGGDRKTGRIEAEAGFLLDQIEASPDLTLAKFQALLDEPGLRVGIGTLWRFLTGMASPLKKDVACERAAT